MQDRFCAWTGPLPAAKGHGGWQAGGHMAGLAGLLRDPQEDAGWPGPSGVHLVSDSWLRDCAVTGASGHSDPEMRHVEQTPCGNHGDQKGGERSAEATWVR